MLKKFGTKILPDNSVNFNFWAPDSMEVKLCIKQPDGSFLELPMQVKEDGWFFLNTNKAQADSEYMFKIESGLMVPDPASRSQAGDAHSPSIVINPNKFDWGTDISWKGRPWQETVLYEIHTGSFTQEGTFKGIKEKLDYLKDLGITAIELMPVADFPGNRNWGYDGVLQFAPDRNYGTPDELKDLIKTAHAKDLMVFLDVVYNHFGPDGNYLYCYAKSKFFEHKHSTPWGDAINFENRHVRDFFIQNTLFWLEEYHFDGIRFDAVHAIKDDSPVNILEELADTVKAEIKDRHTHLVLENDDNIAKPLEKHYESQWNDDFHHCAHIHLTGEKGGYYKDYTEHQNPTWFLARCLAEGFAYQGEVSSYRENTARGEKSTHLKASSFVNFLQNHDQVGNRAFGERIASLCPKDALKAAVCLYLIAPSIPLLFMGEEWGCKEPFMFFCNFDDELSDSIREGRRREFSRFPEFANPANRGEIPDPTLKETFRKSLLDWNKTDPELLEFYKNMLKIRRDYIMPLIPSIKHSESSFEVIGEGCFKVKWIAGNGQMLEVIANLSENDVSYKIDSILKQRWFSDLEKHEMVEGDAPPSFSILNRKSGYPENRITNSQPTYYNVIAKYSSEEKDGKLSAWSVYWLLHK